MSEDLARYRELFVHRDDVFAEQQESGAYFPVKRELTNDEIAEHLAGFASYGVYVIDTTADLPGPPEVYQHQVKYVVFDLDIYDQDAFEHLQWCVEALVDCTPGVRDRCPEVLAENSGGKGYHVWLFFSEPLPAIQVRRWLGWAFWPLWLEGASEEGWPLEVFPKQDTVDEGGYGNLVKLPLGKHAKTGNWSEFIPLTGWASGVSDVVPLDSSLVPQPSGETPVGPVTGGGSAASGSRETQTRFPCIDRILTGDVPKGKREESLFHLALFFYGYGISQDLARAEVLRVNNTFPAPLPEREIDRAVIRAAYSGRYRASCGGDWLRDYCPGPCTKWEVGTSSSEVALKRLKEGDKLTVEVAAIQRQGKTTRVTLTHPDAQNRPTLIVE